MNACSRVIWGKILSQQVNENLREIASFVEFRQKDEKSKIQYERNS